MNQIICKSSIDIEIVNKQIINNLKKRFFLKLFSVLLVIVSLFFTIYYIFLKIKIYNSEISSQKLLNDYNITSIYSTNYSTNQVGKTILLQDYYEFSGSVIGIIEIKKLNLVYPIISEISKDFLKIAPCKFYGVNPNEIGNLCIAAHNYKNGTFFSNISDLMTGDLITIYDTQGNSVDYIIYNVYKTVYTDVGPLNQNTNNSRVITLITCDTLDNNYRTIVKAKEL